ncbi:MAG: DNA mismatch repair endonuclease MutL [Spirochaetales bacterium]|nr:DNA mismatch repair endonuclease MutL [Spirochaetales bacterium]
MQGEMNASRRIKVLREDVAQKIAAGEVIDRPFSVVRELIDNSLDAGSSEISVTIEDGGISRVRVTDDGAGMTEEDLKLCFLPHTTSKIETFSDIYKVDSLGFRGEALASIATCSRLEIISTAPGAECGNRLIVHGGKLVSLEPRAAAKGTTVDAGDLFHNMPARKKFLKSVSGESAMCRAVYIDKALPFPGVGFRYFSNNTLKISLPATDPVARVAAAYGDGIPPSSLHILEESAPHFSLRLIAASPSVCKKDKRYIQIFVNKRRVYEYGLIQAVEYGYRSSMPGKDYPVAFVFLDIEPELVDFNIHPAKKECRIRIIPQIRSVLITLLTTFLSRFHIGISTRTSFVTGDTENQKPLVFDTASGVVKEKSFPFSGGLSSDKARETIKNDRTASFAEEKIVTTIVPHYLGRAFGLFLVAEYGENLYLVDQHAAHERLLFDELKEKDASAQELLFPVSFDLTPDEETQLSADMKSFESLGIRLEKVGTACYEITALPAHYHSIPSSDLIELLKGNNGTIEEIEHRLCSLAACRGAIKDGDEVDSITATEILKGVFALQDARCPHGRPLWYRISKEELFRIVGRK